VLFAGDNPRAVLDIAWSSHYLGLWTLDAEGRRDTFSDFRRLRTDELFLIREKTWHYTDGQCDGDEHAAWTEETHGLDGDTRREEHRVNGGGGNISYSDLDMRTKWRDAPTFGEWGPMLAPDSGTPPIFEAGKHLATSSETVDVPWLPPVPLQPGNYLNDLLHEGAVVLFEGEFPMTTIHQRIGAVSLPSGRLVVCSPTWPTGNLPSDRWAFTEVLPPGRYEVDKVVLTDTEWSSDGPGVAAAYVLRVADSPVIRWEMAVRGCEDTRTLDDGQYFAFARSRGTDGCLTSWEAVPELERMCRDDFEEWAFDTIPDYEDTELRLEGTEFDLIPFDCYFVDYMNPTWIGRDSEDGVVCFLVDNLAVADSPEAWIANKG
jgi:hypothetical protein